MRTMHIPIEAQARGLVKALRNPRTPAQLKPSMARRLHRVYASMNTDARIHVFGESAPANMGD